MSNTSTKSSRPSKSLDEEKRSALETEQFFAERAKNADMGAFEAILNRDGGELPRKGDEVTR